MIDSYGSGRVLGRCMRKSGPAREAAKRVLRAALGRVGLELHRVEPGAEPLAFLRDLGVRTVLDVGANRGQFREEIRRVLPNATIHCFEPAPGPRAELDRIAARDSATFVHPFALGLEDAEVEMNVNEFTPASSLLELTDLAKEAFPHAARAQTQRIAVRALDDWAKTQSLEVPLFVKLDVQGFELNVIRGGERTLRRATAVLTEVCFQPLYEGQPLFDDLHEALRALGFHCAGVGTSASDRRTGRALYGDALYLREG